MAQPFTHPDDLSAILHRADAPAILDMRDAEDAAADPRRIPGAVPVELAALEARDWPAVPTICTCQKGGKLSQLGAGILRARGVPATSMPGGHLAWVARGLPLRSAAPLAGRWVMPPDPGWDDLCALWVLRRLVDRSAPVMAVERDWLARAAESWPAEPLPGTPAAMAATADLDHPALAHLAGGPERLLAGRLARVDAPEAALDLIDDWLEGAA